MILTVTTTHRPATDLGHLLHKHPDRLQAFEVAAGTAYVGYPEAGPDRCTAALVLEVDPVALVRGKQGSVRQAQGNVTAFSLGQYVNDRPYAASSLMSNALVKTFRTAMAGRCDSRPELAANPLPLELHVPALPCRGGADLATRLFAPLGWTVDATPVPLDPELPGWGDSRYVDLRLSGTVRLADALNHVYVLLPVLDDAKHYWVAPDEVDKLIRAGGGWLAGHPERNLITSRYLRRRHGLTSVALSRLAQADDLEPEALDDADAEPLAVEEPTPDRPVPLAELRRGAVLAAVRASGARSVGDLGCGDGVLTAELLADRSLERVVATDVSARSLEIAARRLKVERPSTGALLSLSKGSGHMRPELVEGRLQLFQSSLTYRDERLRGLGAAVLMEVIEHVDPPRLGALERSVFGDARPGTVIVTTPNAEYNVRWETLPAGSRRHGDHRFEWTRAEFREWAGRTAQAYAYTVRFLPVGPDDPEVGPPTQLAIFEHAHD